MIQREHGERTDESRRNKSSVGCGSLIESSSHNLFPIFLSCSPSTFLFAVRASCAWFRPGASGCNPPAALHRSKFRVNSIFTARDFSVEFLDAVQKTVMGIHLQSPGFSIIRDKRDFDLSRDIRRDFSLSFFFYLLFSPRQL